MKHTISQNVETMILAIDNGNTTITIALIKNAKIINSLTIEMDQSKAVLQKKLKFNFSNIHKKYPLISEAVLCSVVPKMIPLICQIVKASMGLTINVIGRHLFVPIKNNYRFPKQVGQDRLLCAYAAKEFYGSPTVVIDLGTAMTFDVVSREGEYEGGMIVPGIRLAAEALYDHTALLPKVHIDRAPKSFIGKDTETSIMSGIYNGYGELCSGVIKRIALSLKHKPKVVATGGYVSLMKPFFHGCVDVIDQDLIFKGLWLISKRTNIDTTIL